MYLWVNLYNRIKSSSIRKDMEFSVKLLAGTNSLRSIFIYNNVCISQKDTHESFSNKE